MPKQSIPACTLHKPTGQARVRLGGRDHYCGRWGTPEARREYNRLIARWLQTADLGERHRASMTIGKLSSAYMAYAAIYYTKAGRQTSQVHIVRYTLRRLVRKFRELPVADLGPKRIKALQLRLISEGCSRKYINGMIGIIKGMIRWGLEEEIIDPSPRNRALLAKGVCWLRAGRSAAAESTPVLPVSQAAIDAVRLHVPPAVWGLIRFQLATGARPAEALTIRGCDITMPPGAAVWEYRPATHKTEHHGRARVVMIGPEGQHALREFLRADTGAYLFSPDADGARCYRRDSYTNCIKRACEIAFAMPVELRTLSQKLRKISAKDRAATKVAWADQFKAAAEWRAAHCWSPNQLRHNFGTRARREAGLEAARVTLGHALAAVSEIYADATWTRPGPWLHESAELQFVTRGIG